MGERTGIAWTDHTFNPWIGCTRVSEGCRHCYAEKLVEGRMGLKRWGNAPRTRTKQPWRDVVKWNEAAKRQDVRRMVFCASLADVFEDAPGLDEIRADLWPLIERCDSLDWQLLTKRPENIRRMVPPAWLAAPLSHVWYGASIENQKAADERIRHLRDTPAAIRFLSVEPLLEATDLSSHLGKSTTRHMRADVQGMLNGKRFGGMTDENGNALPAHEVESRLRQMLADGIEYIPVGKCAGFDVKSGCPGHPNPGIDWVIVGGESGPGARPCDVAWIRTIVKQCVAANVMPFVKQLGSKPVHNGISMADERWPDGTVKTDIGGQWEVRLRDRKGGDPSEWPEDLRVQEFP